MDHELRLRYRPPLESVAALGLAPGSRVLDLGCGTGLFTEEMARQVGPQGKVHGVDLQTAMLDRAVERLRAANLRDRVSFHHSGAYRLPLADASIDAAILIATLCEIPNKLLALGELHRVLRPGARLAISEEMAHPAYVPPPVVKSWLTDAGFRYGGQMGNWFCYTLLFFKNEG
jgi:ubiquinone/menaquinone biosynthesis C-methylase UbiE